MESYLHTVQQRSHIVRNGIDIIAVEGSKSNVFQFAYRSLMADAYDKLHEFLDSFRGSSLVVSAIVQ